MDRRECRWFAPIGGCGGVCCGGLGCKIADGSERLDQVCTGELLVCGPVFEGGCDEEILGAVFGGAPDAKRGIGGVVGVEQVERHVFTGESMDGLGFDV